MKNLSWGLAEIVASRRQTVRFIHQSVKDYLIDGGLKNLDSSFFQDVNLYLSRSRLPNLDISSSDDVLGLAHFRISRSCIKYMTLEKVLDKTLKYRHLYDLPARIMGIDIQLPSSLLFLPYAIRWASHAVMVE